MDEGGIPNKIYSDCASLVPDSLQPQDDMADDGQKHPSSAMPDRNRTEVYNQLGLETDEGSPA